MLRLLLADLRHNAGTWTWSCVVTLVAGACVSGQLRILHGALDSAAKATGVTPQGVPRSTDMLHAARLMSGFIIALVVLAAAAVLVSTAGLALTQRRRDHGLWRALGMRPGSLRALLLGQLVVVAALGDGQELDLAAGGVGLADVAGGDGADALDGDVVEADAGVEGEGGDDGGLGGGVEAVDVGGGVGLGVAELLGGGEGVLEGQALGAHLVEDVVGGAVDDAEHAGDPVPGHGFAQGVDHGDGAGDGGLVVEVGVGSLGGRVELGPVGGDEGLVAGDDAGARLEGRQDEGAGRFDAADELDDDVVAGGDGGGVIGEEVSGHRGVSWCVDVAHGDARDLKARTGAGGEVIGLLGEQTNHLAADGPGAEDADGEGALGGGRVLSHEMTTLLCCVPRAGTSTA